MLNKIILNGAKKRVPMFTVFVPPSAKCNVTVDGLTILVGNSASVEISGRDAITVKNYPYEFRELYVENYVNCRPSLPVGYEMKIYIDDPSKDAYAEVRPGELAPF